MIYVPKYRFDEIAINSTEKKKPIEADKDTYIGLEHLDSGCLEVTHWGADVAPIGDKLVMRKGDVLFGRRRAYQKKVAIAPFDGIFSAHGMVLRPIESVISKEFFPFFISSDYFLDAAIKISVGSLSPTINWRDLAKLEFQIPSLEEQEAISSILWAMNRLKVAYTNLLQQADALVQSQFVEMFGDPILTEKDETLTALSDSCILKAGKFIKADDISDTRQDGQYPCFGGNGIRGYVSQFNQEGERPLIGRQGALCGNVQYATGRFYATEHAVVVTPKGNDINTLWLYYLLQHLKLERYATGAAQPGIAVNKLEQIRVSIPGIMAQTRFSRFARETDKSKYDGKVSLENAWIGGDMCA